MNNCDLCGKEGLTEFTVKSKHLRWILSEDLQKLDTHKNNWLTKNICEECFKKIFGKQEENYTIEQNCGENRVEGGVLSLSVAPKELNEHCKWCKGKGFNCGNCSNKDEENSYYLLHKEKFPEPQKMTFRPFKNCDELIEYWYDFTGVINCSPKLFMPQIWVKHKEYGTENLIIAFDNDNESIGGSCVFIQDIWVDMKELFDNFIFLDGSPCGLEE